MRGVNFFLVIRYIVFAFFMICNAVICSVAAWNFGLVQSTKPRQVDLYLIFLGAFSLLSIITLIFVELLYIKPFTTRVWIECAWVSLFWITELAGGAALIAIGSDMSCSATTSFVHALCTSERVVLAFTWMCAITLLVYLLALVFVAASRSHEDFNIWASDVRTLSVSSPAQAISHPPPPARFRQRTVAANVYTPHPVRSKPTQISHHHGGSGPKYKIEPFPPVFAAPEQADTPRLSNLPEAIPLPPLMVAPITPSSTRNAPALPQDTMNTLSVSLGLYDLPREPSSSITYASPHPPSVQVSKPKSSPSPLGDWPRQDIMKQPIRQRHKHKSTPPSAFEFPRSHPEVEGLTNASPDASAQPRPRRPSGPRMRVPSGDSAHRPATSDSRVSNEPGRRDDDRNGRVARTGI